MPSRNWSRNGRGISDGSNRHLGDVRDHADYLDSWLTLLRQDKAGDFQSRRAGAESGQLGAGRARGRRRSPLNSAPDFQSTPGQSAGRIRAAGAVEYRTAKPVSRRGMLSRWRKPR